MIIEKNRHMNELTKLFRSSEAVTSEELASFTDSSVRTVKNDMKYLNVPLKECLKMACVNPSRKYGFLDRKGTIKTGKDGDFVVIDDDFNVVHTYSRGVSVYDQSKDGKIFNEAYIDSIRK